MHIPRFARDDRDVLGHNEIALLSIAELAPLIRKKKVSPVEAVEAALARIGKWNGQLNAYLTVLGEEARRAAHRAEREIRRGHWRGPLHGVPISLKDNIWTRGVRTTAGSKVLANFVPDEDAALARKLRSAGAILLGKTNLHEFAYGVTTNNAHYGPTRNPWNPERIPGGSSGGSAAAVATGMCAGSIGSDTGGSIRIPAALCGIVGLKPTFGRVSCHGVVPLARSLDHVGPLARSVEDAAILLGAIAGYDGRDSGSAKRPVDDYVRGLHRRKKWRLGWPREYFFERLDPEVERAVEAARRTFEKLGARVEEVSLPHLSESVEPSTHIAFAEALHYHRAAGYYPERKQEYSEELQRRLEAGADVGAVDYLRAFDAQRIVRADFEAAFERVDAILAPVAPITAPRIGESSVKIAGEEETVRSALIRMNRPANFTGLPAISLPCGLSAKGLPIGLQIIGRAFGEAELLQVARAFEQASPASPMHPPGLK
jgi:aspartyl-tRNA(Asn)/glutamyl-tRNA(Gln) amidotransferase subunit A